MISLETALSAARETLASVAERSERQGYYSGARTDIINSHAALCAALDMLVKAAGESSRPRPATPEPGVGPAVADHVDEHLPGQLDGGSSRTMSLTSQRRSGRYASERL